MPQCLAYGRSRYIQLVSRTGPSVPRRVCGQRDGATHHLANFFQPGIHPLQGVEVLPPDVSLLSTETQEAVDGRSIGFGQAAFACALQLLRQFVGEGPERAFVIAGTTAGSHHPVGGIGIAPALPFTREGWNFALTDVVITLI